MWVVLEPHDRLLFRDARPFTAGEAFRATSLWPPTPAPVAAAVKARLLKNRGVDLKDYADAVKSGNGRLREVIDDLGDTDSLGRLRMRGPLLCRYGGQQVEVYFPLPYDLNAKGASLAPLGSPLQGLEMNVRPSIPPAELLWQHESLTWMGEEETCVLSIKGLESYLRQGWLQPGAQEGVWHGVVRMADLAQEETHVGIMLQPGRRQVEPGMLYAAGFVRPRDEVQQTGHHIRTCLLVAVSQLDGQGVQRGALDGATLWLGGERRATTAIVLDDAVLAPLERLWASAPPRCSRVVVYLLTPAVFRKGWRPDAVEDDGVLQDGAVILKLKAAAVGKPLALGRWDLARGHPRPMLRAVPAGSVYHFELQQGTSFEAVVQLLHNTVFLQERAEGDLGVLHQMGFGWTMVGWPQ